MSTTFIAKQKKCRHCKTLFTPVMPMQIACGIECAKAIAKKKREKVEKANDRQKRDSLKSRAQWAREAQAAVNAYVRIRDRDLGCISCDKPASWNGQWHASHFRSVGAASAVRFNLWNIHKSCSICNNWKSGNLSDYEPKLKEKIGAERVEWLRTQNQRADYSIDYLRRIKKVFTKRARLIAERLSHEM